MPQQWLVTGFSLQMSGFNPRAIHVEFVVNKIALRKAFFPVLQFSPANYHSTNTSHSSVNTLKIQGWYNKSILHHSTKGLSLTPSHALL